VDIYNKAKSTPLTQEHDNNNNILPESNTNVHCYTDGSGSSSTATRHTPAGWGFLVVDGPIHSGKVQTTHTSPQYIGAEIGATNTA
jgi:hypothetical protein